MATSNVVHVGQLDLIFDLICTVFLQYYQESLMVTL